MHVAQGSTQFAKPITNDTQDGRLNRLSPFKTVNYLIYPDLLTPHAGVLQYMHPAQTVEEESLKMSSNMHVVKSDSRLHAASLLFISKPDSKSACHRFI